MQDFFIVLPLPKKSFILKSFLGYPFVWGEIDRLVIEVQMLFSNDLQSVYNTRSWKLACKGLQLRRISN